MTEIRLNPRTVALEEFFRFAMRASLNGCDLEGADILVKALDLGLARSEAGAEIGDEWIVITKAGDAPTPNRIEELEDAITEAGIILADGEVSCSAIEAIKKAMQRLGRVMSDPNVMRRQGI